MAPAIVHLGQHVEEERLDVVVQRLVVEEQLRQQTEVLAVDLVLAAVHLEDGDGSVAVDLVARRMPHLALALGWDGTGYTHAHTHQRAVAEPGKSGSASSDLRLTRWRLVTKADFMYFRQYSHM
jgi:hypothetical protein